MNRNTAPSVQVTPPSIKLMIRAMTKLMISDRDLTGLQPKKLRRIDLALDMRDFEGFVLEAIYWCADKGIPPTATNVIRCLEIVRRIKVESVSDYVNNLIEENKDETGGITTLSGFIGLWLKERQLKAQGDAIALIADDEYTDYGEKWDTAFTMLMNVAPDDSFIFDDIGEDELQSLAIKHNQEAVLARKEGRDLGPQFPYLGMKAYFERFKFGEVSLLLGPTGTGKTTHAQILGENIAWRQKLNCDVVHFSLETPKEVLGVRQLCRYQLIPYQRIDDGYVSLTEPKWKQKIEAWNEAKRVANNERGYIRYFYSPNATVNDLVAGMVRATEASKALNRSIVYLVDHMLSINWQSTHGRMDEFAAYRAIFMTLAATANKLSKRTPNHLFVFSQEGDEKGQMFGGKMPGKRSQYVLSFARTRFGAQDSDGNWPAAAENLEIIRAASKLTKEEIQGDMYEKVKDKPEYRALDAEGNPRYWHRKGDEYTHEATIGISKGNDNPLGRVKLNFEARMSRISQDPDQIEDMRKYNLLPPDAI